MVADSTAPATKEDIAMIMHEIGKLYDANERWKNELKDELRMDMSHWKTEIKDDLNQMEHRMLVLIELTRQDLIDAKDDSMENLNIRLKRVEVKVGIEDV
jgi:hypothetical protein